MYRLYPDLRARLGDPLWHDDQGVPRYDPFHPSLCGIYDSFVALLEIECQGCGQRFPVSASWDHGAAFISLRASVSVREDWWKSPVLPTAEDSGHFSFGDAPWHGEHQCSGTTMSTDVSRILEFWTRDGEPCLEWRRRPEYEFVYDLDGSGEQP